MSCCARDPAGDRFPYSKMQKIKLLTFSTLYPNAVQQRHGIFVETRLRHLLAGGEVQSRVLAPVPWFPLKQAVFGEYASYARVPARERRFDIDIQHPKFPRIPKIGMTLAPMLMAATLYPASRAVIRNGYDFDIIDAHYFYPDGVAAALIAGKLGKPFTITARGTDLNLIPKYLLPRKMIQWAAGRADALITVCQALKDALVALDVPEDKVTVLRNGVDLELFQPIDRESMRKRLGIHRLTLLSVGHLIKRKAHDIPIRALKRLPEVELFIAGDGEEERALKELANSEGVAHRVRFLGPIPQKELKNYYGAVDALVLASSREGWANVLLESMACGTPVIASNVWGTPEVVAAPEAGVLMRERTPEALAEACHELLAHYPDHAATRRYAEGFSWDETTRGQVRIFSRIIEGRKAK